MYVVTPEDRLNACERLALAIRRGYRKSTGRPMAWPKARERAGQVMDALPGIYSVGEHADIPLGDDR